MAYWRCQLVVMFNLTELEVWRRIKLIFYNELIEVYIIYRKSRLFEVYSSVIFFLVSVPSWAAIVITQVLHIFITQAAPSHSPDGTSATQPQALTNVLCLCGFPGAQNRHLCAWRFHLPHALPDRDKWERGRKGGHKAQVLVFSSVESG